MLAVQPPESDLIVTQPSAGEVWDPHTIHTHYFGFCVPDAQVGVFTYIRYQPAFPLSQGGVLVYRGLENRFLADSLFHDYQITMPWPEIDGNAFTTVNGLTYDFVEPGRRARLRFTSHDGETSFDIDAVAVTELAARGHVMPGEELHTDQSSGGSEQFMHCTGWLRVAGEEYAVDSLYPRDRSWRQVRAEDRDSPPGPPMCWTPVYFDETLALNQVGFEDPAASPPWAGAYDLADDARTHHFAWVSRDGQVRDIVDVRRRVTRVHPFNHAPLDMEISATDEDGDTYHLTGEAIAFCPLPGWPNLSSFETLMRWRTDDGKVGYGPAQSVWNQHAQHVLNEAARAHA
jgi:hypothetical protein